MHRHLTLLLALLGAAGCGDGTRTFVRFALGEGVQGSALRVQAWDAEGEAIYDLLREVGGEPMLTLPASVPFSPRDGRTERRFVVLGTLLDGGALVQAQSVEVLGHVPGETREVWLCFSEACAGVACGEGERCVAGDCAPRAVSPLPVGATGPDEACAGGLPRMDAGTPVPDAGDAGDAGDDGGGGDAGLDGGCDCPCGDACDGAGGCVPTTRFAEAALGQSHSCAVTTDGRLFCWGANVSGQLGAGGAMETEPVEVSLPEAARSIAAGDRHSCAALGDWRLFCWGANDRRQLANGAEDQPAPAPSAPGFLWDQVVAGGEHTCARTTTDELYCWGANDVGQVTGPDAEVGSPRLVLRGAYRDVAAGDRHTCGVRTNERDVLCWGAQGNARLGEGDAVLTEPVRGPREISNFTPRDFDDVELGRAHSCGVVVSAIPMMLGTARHLRCWGQNRNLQVGSCSSCPERLFPALVPSEPPHLAGVRSLALGEQHSCAVLMDGELHCWGDNGSGQLGGGDTGTKNPPRRIGAGFASVFAGGQHTCGIDAEGRLFCWGRNAAGQLGLGDLMDREAAERVCVP